MTWPTRKYADSSVEPVKLPSNRFRRFSRDYFGVQPICEASTGYGDPVGTTGAVNLMLTPQASYEYVMLGLGQTILAPVWSASGLDIALDATDDEGCEITQGITALSPAVRVCGTDRAFYFKVTLTMSDVSVCDTLYVGFRIVQAYQTAIASYTDFACLGINASAAAAKIKIITNLNGAGESETDTTMTWADGATKTFEIRVNEDRYASFLVNDAQPTVTNTAFRFDADSVIPFLFHLRGSTAANSINLTLWEQGFLPRRAE